MDHNIARLQAEAIASVRAQTAVPNLYLTGTTATTQTPCSQMRTPLGKQDQGGRKTFHEIRGHAAAVPWGEARAAGAHQNGVAWSQQEKERAVPPPAPGRGFPAL